MVDENASDKKMTAQVSYERSSEPPRELAERADRIEDENARLRSRIRELEVTRRERERDREREQLRDQPAGSESRDLAAETRELESQNEALRRDLRALEDQLNLRPSQRLRRQEPRAQSRDSEASRSTEGGSSGRLSVGVRNSSSGLDDLIGCFTSVCRR